MIMIACVPEPGHILPTIPMARRLRASGLAVGYLTTQEYQGPLRERGFEVELYSNSHSGTAASHLYNGSRLGKQLWLEMLSGEIRARRLFLKNRLREVTVARELKALIVDRLFAFYGVPVDDLGVPVLHLWTSLPAWQLPLSAWDENHLILCPKEFEVPAHQRSDPGIRYVEPSIDVARTEVEFPFDKIDRRKPLVVCAFGTQLERHEETFELLRTVLAAATQMPELQFVVACGTGYAGIGLGAAENVLVQQHIPQLTLLQSSALLITHGGLGSIKEALFMGVPLLTLPLGYDQPLNALRVEKLHAGKWMSPSSVSEPALVRLIREVLDSGTIRRSVEHVRSVFREREREAPSTQFILGAMK